MAGSRQRIVSLLMPVQQEAEVSEEDSMSLYRPSHSKDEPYGPVPLRFPFKTKKRETTAMTFMSG